jgi:hypothetical protein
MLLEYFSVGLVFKVKNIFKEHIFYTKLCLKLNSLKKNFYRFLKDL